MKTCLVLIPFAAFNIFGQTLQSPAQKQIDLAQIEIQKSPARSAGYNRLALAYARRARETSDTAFYTKGEEALERSFKLDPDNLDGRKNQAWIALGKHEFKKALAIATKLNQKAPDDSSIYGILVDANVELGNYAEAEKAVQAMFNLRPPTVPSLTRGSYLRELFGDLEGAIEFMTKAFDMAGYDEREDRAWMLTQVAQLERKRGRHAEAQRLASEALKLFPDYHYALGALARINIELGKFPEAVALEEKRHAAAPHPENLYALAVAQQKAGLLKQAQTSFQEFEKKSLQEMESTDNSNHELIFFYADFGNKPEEALKVAKFEASRRQDVHTLDAYAWALFVNEQYDEASRTMAKALAVGVKDPDILGHARKIADKVTPPSKP